MYMGKKFLINLLCFVLSYIAVFTFSLFYLPTLLDKMHLVYTPPKIIYPQYSVYVPNQLEMYIQPQLDALKQISFMQTPKFLINPETETSATSATPLTVGVHCKVCLTFLNTPEQKKQQVFKKTHQFLTLQNFVFLPVSHLYSTKTRIHEFNTRKFYALSKDQAILKALNLPDIQIEYVQNVAQLAKTLRNHPNILGFVQVQDLTPALKVVSTKNQTFLDTRNPNDAMLVSIDLIVPKEHYKDVYNIMQARRLIASYHKPHITTLIYTGVTAISRNLALAIERAGSPIYPTTPELTQFLRSATYTHTSNEVSFVPGCKPTQSMRFCSAPEYFQLLKHVGIDIIELTGNHNNDYSAKWNAWTIQNIYKPNNIKYFGGGVNINDAKKPTILTSEHIKIGLLGYNYYDTIYNHTNALATKTHAGANPFYWKQIQQDIQNLRKKVDIIVVSVQFQECYSYPPADVIYPVCYKPLRWPDQKKTFRKIVDLGADIVVGTQAHQPQTFEMYKNSLIFYGLGNLFFDQIYWIGTRQALALKFYFYQNKLINVKIVPLQQSKDFKQHIATPEQGKLLLQLLDQARNSL